MFIAQQSSAEVISAERIESSQVDQFVAEHPDGMLYYGQKYRQLLEKVAGGTAAYQVVIENGEITGLLPAFYLDGPLGRVWNSLPWFGSHGGPLCTTEVAKNALINWWNAEISKNGVAAGTIISNPFTPLNGKLINHHFTDVRTGQFTPLPHAESEDLDSALMDLLHSKTRNMIRKAGRQNIKVRIQNDAFDFVEKIHQENMTVIGGTAKSRAYFDTIRNDFTPGKAYNIYVASLNDEDIAAILILYQNNVVEYFTPVVKAEFRSVQPISLLIFTAMLDASGDGFRLWNWGGTWKSQEGVHRFKKRWGTTDQDYHYFTKVNNPNIFTRTTNQLLEMYPNFYVVPFGVLNSGGNDEK